MSSLLSRVRGLSWPRRGHSQAKKETALVDPENISLKIGRKIHPDLNSLLEQEPTAKPYIPLDDPFALHIPRSPSSETTPLSLNYTRRRSRGIEPLHDRNLDTSDAQTDAGVPAVNPTEDDSRKPDQSTSSSNTSNTSEQNVSGGTFGPRYTAHHGPKKVMPVPMTPADGQSKTQGDSERTPGSTSERSHDGRSRANTVSSSNTFGLPSPKVTPVKRRKHSVSSTELPPLPPLNHPAFKAATGDKKGSLLERSITVIPSKNEPDEMGRQSKVARHSHSLPSLSDNDRPSSELKRNRTRTESQIKRYEFFADAKSSTPASRRRTHNRSRSNASQSSSRRASAEFSAEQASSAGIGGSWEAQVSREMVRIALQQGWSTSEQNAGGAVLSQSGQARGTRVVAHTHRSTAAKHCSSSPFTSEISNRKIIPLSMSKESSRRSSPNAKSRPIERSGSPSRPKTTVSTSSGAPSSSQLAPPSLSFTAATPITPISPILRPPVPNSREATTSVQRSLSSSAAERPSSSYSSKGKRKADEAGVGGGTPPKEAKEPRATFAIEPRRHRASANSNSTRSNAPSSYHRKRARLSAPQETRPGSRPGSRESSDHQQSQHLNQNASTTGSWSSKMSKNSKNSAARASVQGRDLRPVTPSSPQRAPSRRSLSQASIPMSALISPHAPSLSHAGTFHMRDPRKPAPIQSTPWSLSFPTGDAEPGEGWGGWTDRGGSPLHAWLFFVGFVLFPLWWIASFTSIPKTRTLDGQEKGLVVLDDPQVEHAHPSVDQAYLSRESITPASPEQSITYFSQ
ncbi:hypothetical protein H0H93_016389 [Arthromyces matolae]|nr:hypothetical protein H0H93_016389 [Arthromyces matolae]